MSVSVWSMWFASCKTWILRAICRHLCKPILSTSSYYACNHKAPMYCTNCLLFGWFDAFLCLTRSQTSKVVLCATAKRSLLSYCKSIDPHWFWKRAVRNYTSIHQAYLKKKRTSKQLPFTSWRIKAPTFSYDSYGIDPVRLLGVTSIGIHSHCHCADYRRVWMKSSHLIS